MKNDILLIPLGKAVNEVIKALVNQGKYLNTAVFLGSLTHQVLTVIEKNS
ncbi:hypothetical protein [Bacillus sp. FSL K6-3431]